MFVCACMGVNKPIAAYFVRPRREEEEEEYHERLRFNFSEFSADIPHYS